MCSAETLSRQGSTELGASLAIAAPSIDFPRSAGTDGTDSIRPATLRGLSPDQTLVLINGVRGHASALLNVNGSVGRGAAAVDLNTIPTLALAGRSAARWRLGAIWFGRDRGRGEPAPARGRPWRRRDRFLWPV
jgi:hypothetical protein